MFSMAGLNSLCARRCRNPYAHGPSPSQEAAAYAKWLSFEERVFGDSNTVTVHCNYSWDLSAHDNKVIHYILYHQRNRNKYYYVNFDSPSTYTIIKKNTNKPNLDIDFSPIY